MNLLLAQLRLSAGYAESTLNLEAGTLGACEKAGAVPRWILLALVGLAISECRVSLDEARQLLTAPGIPVGLAEP